MIRKEEESCGSGRANGLSHMNTDELSRGIEESQNSGVNDVPIRARRGG